MTTRTDRYLTPAAAARRLGVSTKALRLYEQRGLLEPARTAAGWRSYGPQHLARAAEVVALRALGLSLAQIARVLGGDARELEGALAAHQRALQGRSEALGETARRVQALREALARGERPAAGELARLLQPEAVRRRAPPVAFTLPWPWGGERFELQDIRALNHIVGPMGSGKTRLAQRLAQVLPKARFVGLERAAHDAALARARLAEDSALRVRVEQAQDWLVEDGASASPALLALLVALLDEGPQCLVFDLIEQGLDRATQQALIAHLRRRAARTEGPLLFLMTRSTAMLDLEAVGPDETILLCRANHSPPSVVVPVPGAAGYEALASCLAAPEVRARTEGMVAVRPAA